MLFQYRNYVEGAYFNVKGNRKLKTCMIIMRKLHRLSS